MEMKKKRFGSFLCFSPPVDDDDEKSDKSKKSNRKIVTKIVRTMSLKSSSSKRGRKREKDHGISRSQADTGSFRENLNYPSSLRSSSPPSISSDNIVADNNLSTQRLKDGKTKTASITSRKYRSFISICLITLSLFVMIFFGRLFAVLLTTLWMCFVPRRRLKGELVDIADVPGVKKL